VVWGIHLEEVKRMKFFTKKVQEKQNVKVDPRSQKFVDTIKLLLEEHGITNPRALNECSHKLLKLTLHFFKNLSPGDDYTVEEVAELEVKFRAILTGYGIAEEDTQDEIFIGFFGTLNELGAEGLKE
jgi:hypothetical protein